MLVTPIPEISNIKIHQRARFIFLDILAPIGFAQQGEQNADRGEESDNQQM